MLDEFNEIIDYAIQNEKDAYKLYSYLSKKMNDQAAKKLLADLANEEKNHKIQLENFKQLGIERFKIRKVKDLKLTDHMVTDKVSLEASPQELLLYAIKKENEAYILYRELKESVEDPDSIVAFDELSKFELEHKNKLERLYDDLFNRDN